MLNRIYEWIGTGIGNRLRNGEPAADHHHLAGGDAPPGDEAPEGGRVSRKRPLECLEDGDDVVPDGLAVKKSRMGDLIDTVKIAAEGVKSHSSNVATWVRSMSPALKNILPASPPPPGPPSEDLQPLPSTSAAAAWEREEDKNPASLDETFAAPSTTLQWKTTKSVEPFRNERTFVGSKVCRRQACMSLVHREVPKTNGHSLSLPPSYTPRAYPLPRLGRPLNLRPQGTSSQFTAHGSGTSGSSFSSMYEKTFPIKVVQSPTHSSTSSSRLPGPRARCTAQESIHEEEKEVYRQLLNMVCGGQSSAHNGSSHTIMRSHRDFTSFLSTSRRLVKVPCATGAEGTPEGPSGPPSPQEISSQGSSSLPSPAAEASGGPGNQTSSPDSVLRPSLADIQHSAPSPAALQDTSSQDTQSSAFDGDSVIIVKEQKGKKPDTSSVPCFQAELWIKELTSMYDSRARERRRQIEEQEALAAQLLRQRLSDESQLSPVVEVHVRVPLEKEIPLTPITEEPETKPLEEKPEFPELDEEMEEDVNAAMRGSPHEVLSEGFGLSLTRKDLQTLSNLNWLNDEVINFYMNLLVQRSKGPGLPRVETFNTFFYPKLRSSGYSSVRRWTKKIDIFSVDILLVPVHLGVHWCLSVVDLRKKAILYFDSMGGNNDQACSILLDYLQQESKDKKGKELDTSGWSVHSKRRNEIPQQMNGSDCGMFTCKYAEYITKDKPITFTQSHMPYFRKRMIWELLNRQLL